MKIKYLHIFIISLTIFLCSCEAYLFESDPENSPKNNFEHLWNDVNHKYSFFDVKNINWDSIYVIYNSKIRDRMNDTELFNVMADMLNELKDGHVNLISPFNISSYDITSLGKQNINTRVIKENYLKDDYYTTGSFVHNFIANDRIGYIRYSSFDASQITEYELDFIINRYKYTDGLIIDIRQNGGGYVTNVFKLIGRFSSSEKFLYKTQIKSGSGKNDFSDFEDVYSPKTDKIKYLGKNVAILTDRGTYSASSYFALCTYAYDNIFIVGDTTGGGLGLPNGGQLPNGWTYRFSITRTLATDGNNYENGIPPDYTVILSDSDIAEGKDNIIEFAVTKLISGY